MRQVAPLCRLGAAALVVGAAAVLGSQLLLALAILLMRLVLASGAVELAAGLLVNPVYAGAIGDLLGQIELAGLALSGPGGTTLVGAPPGAAPRADIASGAAPIAVAVGPSTTIVSRAVAFASVSLATTSIGIALLIGSLRRRGATTAPPRSRAVWLTTAAFVAGWVLVAQALARVLRAPATVADLEESGALPFLFHELLGLSGETYDVVTTALRALDRAVGGPASVVGLLAGAMAIVTTAMALRRMRRAGGLVERLSGAFGDLRAAIARADSSASLTQALALALVVAILPSGGPLAILASPMLLTAGPHAVTGDGNLASLSAMVIADGSSNGEAAGRPGEAWTLAGARDWSVTDPNPIAAVLVSDATLAAATLSPPLDRHVLPDPSQPSTAAIPLPTLPASRAVASDPETSDPAMAVVRPDERPSAVPLDTASGQESAVDPVPSIGSLFARERGGAGDSSRPAFLATLRTGAAVLPASPAPAPRPPGPSRVVVERGRGGFEYRVDGRRVLIRGMGYNPTYTGRPTPERRAQLDRDFRMMREIGVNTVVGWSSQEFDGLLLDVADQHNIGVVLPFELSETADYADQRVRAETLRAILAWVDQHRSHPALRMWGIGNEVMLNMRQHGRLSAFAEFYVDVVHAVRARDPDHPVLYREAEDVQVGWIQDFMAKRGGYIPGFVYGMNFYTFRMGPALEFWPRRKFDVPVLISEFSPGGLPRHERPAGLRKMWGFARQHTDWVLGAAVYVWSTDGPEAVDRVFGIVNAAGEPVDGSLATLRALFGEAAGTADGSPR